MQVSICGLRAYEFLDEFGVYIGVAEAVAILRILSDSRKQKEDLVCVQHSPPKAHGKNLDFFCVSSEGVGMHARSHPTRLLYQHTTTLCGP